MRTSAVNRMRTNASAYTDTLGAAVFSRSISSMVNTRCSRVMNGVHMGFLGGDKGIGSRW